MKFLLAIAVLQFSACSGNAQSSGLAILKTFNIQGSGGWDYLALNPLNDNLYVSHGTQVNILNKRTGDSVGVFTGTTGVHGIVFAPEFGKGYISNGRLSNVLVFDARTNRVLGSIPAGTNPDAMCYDSYSKRLVVGNGQSKDATIIDAATNNVIATIPLGGKPEASVADDKGKVFINIEDKNEVAALDMQTLKITARYPLSGGEKPAGLAIDKAKGMLFVGCANRRLIVLDANTGRQITLLPIGDHCDGTGFDSGTGNAFAANGDGTLTVIHAVGNNGYKVIEHVPTKRGARTIAVDQSTHLIYLPTADFEPHPDARERQKTIPGTFKVLVIGQR